MKRLLKWLLGIILVIPTTVLVVLLLVVVLLFTNVGLSTSLWVAQKFVPELKVGEMQGSLLPAFTLHDVQYNNTDIPINVRLKQFDFSVTLDCLLQRSVCVDTVAIQGLKLELPSLPEPSDTQENAKSSMPALFLPIPISLTHLTLNDIDLNILGNKVSWKSFSSGLYMQGKTLTISPTQWQAIRLSLASTKEQSSGAKPSSKEKAIPLSQQPDIKLPNITLPLNLNIESFEVKDFKMAGETPIVVNRLALMGDTRGSKVNIMRLQLDAPQADVDAKAKVTLSGDYPLSLRMNSQLKIPELNGQKIRLEADGSAADLSLRTQLSNGAQAHLQAKLQPLKAALPFDIQLSQTKVRWPLKGPSDYQLSVPDLSAKGSLEQYHFTFQAEASGGDIPSTGLEAIGSGNMSQVSIKRITLDTLGGHISGQVMANWQHLFYWTATLGLTDIQPGLQWPQAEGKISGSIVNSGSLTKQDGWQVKVPSLDIKGVLRQYPIVIKGQLNASDINGDGNVNLKTRGLRISHADNGLLMKGDLGKKWHMDLDVSAPKLSQSIPQVKGSVKGMVRLRGLQKQPKIYTNVEANNIALPEMEATLKSLSIKGEVSPLPAPSGDISLLASQGKYQNRTLETLKLRFVGDEAKHQLDFDAITDIVATHFVLTGGVSDKSKTHWKGQLESALIELKQPELQSQRWQLDHPLPLAYQIDKQTAQIDAHCWSNSPAKICLENNATLGEKGEAAISVKHFVFSQLKAFIPADTVISGELNATAWAKWAPNTAPQVKLDVMIPKGYVTQNLATPVTLGWEDIKLSANLRNNTLDLNWLLDLINNGDIKGNISIKDVQGQRPIMQGKNVIKHINLSFLSPLLGEQNLMQADINSSLTFQGPMLKPKVVGDFRVLDMKLKGQMFPVDVNSGEVNTQFNGYSAKLNSNLHTPDGELNLKGDADWSNLEKWRVNLRVYGDELKVEAPPMVRLKVKPDLTITITPTLAKITGNIDIPWGRILVEELPESAVSVSKDEVILDQNLKPIEKSTGLPMELETDITINIGNDVSLSAFGLRGNLVGSLKVSQKNKGPFIFGEIRIENGSYRSFGQDLIIKEGKILMNGPADQPYVSIKAIRNPDNTQDDVIAGITVTGPADAPEVVVFSEPAMPQTNALSYLLRGQDIEGGSGGSAMTTALIGLSLAKSGKVVGQIGEKFGVQDLQLGTAGSGDDSQVTVSGYIAPGLQVKYGVGIFNSLGEFTVRYELMSDFYVEAVTGLDSAVDFIYQFSFN
ncbi:autotransporter assembly complex protein TamB [Vibrio hibernica]|uniref:autotransporter assembly complex protein TamB n=1 Tax=Vibrio hibernica TaxID=2587465 RepID=UPI001882F102|nr:translocation/assembly module TamB domain-containing protein [Vibrio hibernica]